MGSHFSSADAGSSTFHSNALGTNVSHFLTPVDSIPCHLQAYEWICGIVVTLL